MSIPIVTLQELADFLLTLPPELPINMMAGSKRDRSGGCLMTKYGVHMNWEFDECYCQEGWITYTGKRVATLNGNVFNIFKNAPPLNELKIVKAWQNQLKSEYLH